MKRLVTKMEYMFILSVLVIIGLMFAIFFMATIPSAAYAFDIPEEPGQDKVLGRFINPSIGAFLIVYDMDGDGMVDNETELFVDVERDGLNGNEILYAKWMEEEENVGT